MSNTAQNNKDIYERTVNRLREKKIRITPQREEIVKYLIESKSHPTVDDIYQELSPRFASMSLATVYNNINLLTKMGLIREIKYGDNSSRYDFVNQKHYHVICETCGKIEDLYYPVLDEVERFAEQITDFEVHFHRLEIYGLCGECRAKAAAEQVKKETTSLGQKA